MTVSEIKVTKPLAIALMGPTAAGKTELALTLAEQLHTDIVSVDSALVYRHLNIGSAKPSAAEMSRVPHHLIDMCEPSVVFSAADFVRHAKMIISQLRAAGKTPLLAGGTMLYFKALLEGLSDLPAANVRVRAEIESEAAQKGWPAIHAQLADVDPITAARLHPNHSQRLSRALEVYRTTGKPMSQWQTGGEGGLLDDFNWVQIAIAPRDRKVLHHRIEQRYQHMLAQGFVDEVKGLRAVAANHKDLPAFKSVGYRQVWDFLDGECDYSQMIDKGLAATRQLAKRQLTWLRSWPELNWLYTQNIDGSMRSFDEILDNALNFLPKTAL